MHSHSLSPSASGKPRDVILAAARIDPAVGDGFGVLVAHPAAVDVGDARREDRQGAFYGFHVVVLPVEFGAAVGHIVAVEDPGQHAADRLGGLLAGGPVAVPGVEGFAGGVALQVEDRKHEQRLLRRALAQQRTLLQVELQPGVHAAHDHQQANVGEATLQIRSEREPMVTRLRTLTPSESGS